ncbi:MAG: hypothetical protein J6C79_00155 [Clostridia bacterium]|nr:hypothetical protein [Clostridia bacterium]
MKNKENVYVEKIGTEKVMEERAATGEHSGASQEVSTVAGKFKDVSALIRAYKSLQAEFTRRSQRLKELEKLAENSKDDVHVAERSGAEKLRKNAENRREKTKAFDAFVLDVNKAHVLAEPDGEKDENAELATVEVRAESYAENFAENAENAVNEQVRVETTAVEKETLAEKDCVRKGEENAKKPSVAGNAPTAEELYLQVCRDEGVRLRIIGEYLTSVGRGGAPITATGAGTFVSPPRKARTIGDAAAMALQYFKKP